MASTDNEQVFLVPDTDRSERLDVYLTAKLPDISRSQVQRLIDTGSVQVNGSMGKPSQKVVSGDLILVTMLPPKVSHIAPEDIPLDIVYEDNDIVVLNKAKGMVVHPAPGSEDGTLVNALLGYGTEWSGIGGVIRPGIVHRLDKDTTGLLVVAKSDVAHNDLQAQIQKRTAKRRYLALVWGRTPFEEAVIDLPVGRHPVDRKRMAVIEPSTRLPARNAVTEVSLRERLGPLEAFTLLECTLQTGRTHQIRVHLSYAGYPVVGDSTYGGSRKVGADLLRSPQSSRLNERIASLHGQALHAFSLAFEHPLTRERLSFEVPMPPEMSDLIDCLRRLRDEIPDA